MTERIFLDRSPILGTTSLNPVRIIQQLKRTRNTQRCAIATDIVIHYTPQVGTDTAGLVYLGFRLHKEGADPPIDCNPLYCGPVWKSGCLRIPKRLVSTKQWCTVNDLSPYLIVTGTMGTVTITCTIVSLQLTNQQLTPIQQLGSIETNCYVGPRLVGLSIATCLPDLYYEHYFTGVWNVCNIDLSMGTVVYSRDVLAPEDRPYVVVRYIACDTNLTFRKPTNWKYSQGTITYPEEGDWQPWDSYLGFRYGGSWNTINKRNWCEMVYTVVNYTAIGGKSQNQPVSATFLYFDFGDVDIFKPSFSPQLTCTPGRLFPADAPIPEPGKPMKLPMLTSKIMLLYSPYWNPSNDKGGPPTAELVSQLQAGRQALESWPVETDDS